MEWIANVTVQATFPSQERHINLFPLPADSEIDAARLAAQRVANVLFHHDPSVCKVQPLEGNNLFIAGIGDYRHGVTRGTSLRILVRRYAGK